MGYKCGAYILGNENVNFALLERHIYRGIPKRYIFSLQPKNTHQKNYYEI